MPLDIPRIAVIAGSDDALALPPEPASMHDSDAALLDAYSAAVTGAVARVAPAVVHLSVEQVAAAAADVPPARAPAS